MTKKSRFWILKLEINLVDRLLASNHYCQQKEHHPNHQKTLVKPFQHLTRARQEPQMETRGPKISDFRTLTT